MADRLQVDLSVTNEQRANRAVANFRGNLKAAAKEIDDLGKTSFAGSFDQQMARAERRHRQFLQTIRNQGRGSGGSGGGFLGGAADGLGAGNLAGAAIGTAVGAGLVKFTNDAIAAAKEAENAQAVLRAGAKETGQAFDELAAKAENFGRRVNLSNTEAQKTYAQLLNFANAAGRTDKLDEFQKRFADLAAAKGINASQLGDISRQLNALTDEATDKLLNANPSAFYDKFAASIGKTADQLSDAEKRAAVFDEVLRKGAIFDGEADKRLNSFGGEIDAARKKLDDFTASAGEATKPVIGLTLAVAGLFGSDGAAAGATAQGFNKFFENAGLLKTVLIPVKIAVDFVDNASRAIFGKIFPDQAGTIQADQESNARVNAAVEFLRSSDAEIKAAQADPRANMRNFALSRVNLADGFNSQADREKAINEAVTEADKDFAEMKKRFERSIKSGGSQRFSFAEFTANRGLFSKEDQEKFVEGFSKASADAFAAATQKAGDGVRELRRILADAVKSPELQGGDFDRVSASINQAIEKSITAAKQRIDAVRASARELFSELTAQAGGDNPFVRHFDDAAAAIERTDKATQGLSESLRTQARQMTETANANALFATRLSEAMKASDLRADAAAFRAGNDAGDPRLKASVERFRREFESGLHRNPANLAIARAGRTGVDALASFDLQREIEMSGGMFRNPDADRQLRDRIAAAAGPSSVNERIDRQLAVIASLRPENEQQRREADRAIIALTQGQTGLTDAANNEAAAAREREALRIEQGERDARQRETNRDTVFKNIETDIGKLTKIAESEGLTGTIRIIDQTNGGVDVELSNRPTSKDAGGLMKR